MRPDTSGWVDHVVTPAGAFAFMVAEDALDHYFVEWVERRVGNRVVRGILRVVFHPSRTFANVVQNRAPWHRPDRRLTLKCRFQNSDCRFDFRLIESAI